MLLIFGKPNDDIYSLGCINFLDRYLKPSWDFSVRNPSEQLVNDIHTALRAPGDHDQLNQSYNLAKILLSFESTDSKV